MDLSNREWWAATHGMVLGGLFLLAFAGGFAGLYSLRPQLVTVEGIKERMTRLKVGVTGMAIVAWVTVITGSFIVYLWYRAVRVKGADITAYPKALLLSKASTAEWHNFGMEWKEHIAWLAPILAKVAAFMVIYYNRQLIVDKVLRRATMTVFVLAFASAAVAGLLGAFITKAAPVH